MISLIRQQEYSDAQTEQNGGCHRLGGEGKEELLFSGDRVSVEEHRKFWRWRMVMVAHQCKWTQSHQNVHINGYMLKFISPK